MHAPAGSSRGLTLTMTLAVGLMTGCPGVLDAGLDAGAVADSGAPDAAVMGGDAGASDASTVDSGVGHDAGASDAGTVDAGAVDASVANDGGERDAGAQSAEVPDITGTPLIASLSGLDSNPGTLEAPKPLNGATLELAMRAGVGLLIRGGTYTPDSSFFDVASLSSSANGTARSWAVMKPYQNEPVTLNFGTNTIAWDNRHYWCVRDLTINHTNGWAFFCGENSRSDHLWVHNVTFNFTMPSAGSNRAPIGVPNGNMDYLWMTQCVVNGVGAASTAEWNSCGVWCGYVKHLAVVGNRFTNLPIGIYQKYAHNASSPAEVSIDIRNNIVESCTREGILIEGQWSEVRNNLVLNGAGMGTGTDEGVQNCDDVSWVHNTVYATDLGLIYNSGGSPGALRNRLRSNLFAHGAKLKIHQYTTVDPLVDSDYNLVTTEANAIARYDGQYSLAAYRAAFSGQEVHSVAANASFVGGASPTSASPAGFALTNGSPGWHAADDGTDMGCDVSKLLTLTR